MSFLDNVDNMLQQAHALHTEGNIQGCLAKHIETMNLLAEEKRRCADKAEYYTNQLNYVANEFNLIRQKNPTIEFSVEGDLPEIEKKSLICGIEVPKEVSEGFGKMSKAMKDACTSVPTYITGIDEKYHIVATLKGTCQKSKDSMESAWDTTRKRVYDGYVNASEWMKEKQIKKRTIDGVTYLANLIVQGTVVSSQYISNVVMDAIRMTAAGISSPQPENEVKTQTVIEEATKENITEQERPTEDRDKVEEVNED